MKTLLIAFSLFSITLLSGCDAPQPMSAAEADIFKHCLDKGRQPRFFANGAKRDITCWRK